MKTPDDLLSAPPASASPSLLQAPARLAAFALLAFLQAHCSVEYAPTIHPHTTVSVGQQQMIFLPPVQGGEPAPDPLMAQLGPTLGVQPGGSNYLALGAVLRIGLDARAYRTAQILIDDASLSLERADDQETLVALPLNPHQSPPPPLPLDSGATVEQPVLLLAAVDDTLRDQICAGLAVRLRATPLDRSTGDRSEDHSEPFTISCPPRHATAALQVIDAYLLIADTPDGSPATKGELHAIFSEEFSLGHEESRQIFHDSNVFASFAPPTSTPPAPLPPDLLALNGEISFTSNPTPLESDSSATTGLVWTSQVPDLSQAPWLCTGLTRFSTVAAFLLPGEDGSFPDKNLYPLEAPPVKVRCTHTTP